MNFYNDLEEMCPTSETCKDKAYVIPGDKVVVSRTFKAFGCSWYTSEKGMPTIGWIKLEKLKMLPAGQLPRLNDWLGGWQYADNSIRLARDGRRGNLRITGNAFWKGLGDNIHIGELDSVSSPKGNLLKIGESDADKYACKVTIRLIEDFLVVSDNMNCGGANVTFSGVYRRKK